MLLLLSLCSAISDFNETNPCSFNNTQAVNGVCKCIPGFIGNDPPDVRGCWKCEKSCLESAKCDFPGVCTCKNGYDGDGFTSCSAPTAHILQAEQSNSSSIYKNSVRLSIKLEHRFNPYFTLCRFDNADHYGVYIDENTVYCPFSSLDSGEKMIRLSFDGKTWSNEKKSILRFEKATKRVEITSTEPLIPYQTESTTWKYYVEVILMIIMVILWRRSPQDEHRIPYALDPLSRPNFIAKNNMKNSI